MIAVDTNILVYAHREDSTFYKKAEHILTELAESKKDWAIPWPCVHEFLAIVTHPRIYKPATSLEMALCQLDCWFESPGLHLIGELYDYWEILKDLLNSAKLLGPQIHDARIVALCIQNGVDTLWSADRDFSRIGKLKIKNPLIE